MAKIISARNLNLSVIGRDVSLAANFESNIIDFKEMNSGFIQVVTTETPTLLTGEFFLKVSLLCDPSTFFPYPESTRVLGSCQNYGWSFCCVPFRYAMVCYTSNTTSDGVIDIYARGKRS